MPRITIVPEDSIVIVDDVPRQVAMPDCDPNWHALQYYPDLDLLTFEVKQGFRDALRGEEAAAVLQPFIDAHAAAEA